MIDIKQGIITLCESEFQITADTTPQALTEAIPALISQVHPVSTGYTHYNCWLDIEPQCYLWASVCFHGEALESIRLFPQHQSATAPAPRPDPMDTESSHLLGYAWYGKFFEQDELSFPRGSIRYVQGRDPIYSPTCVLIRYISK